MTGEVYGSSDILPPSFYTSPSAEPTLQGQVPVAERAVTIGRSAEEVARDPANLSGALLLPLLSYNDYQEFLKYGLQWFQAPETAAAKAGVDQKALGFVDEQLHEIISGMLDAWNEGIRQVEETRKMIENSPLYLMIQEEMHRRWAGEEMTNSLSTSVAALVITASFVGIAGDLEGLPALNQAWNHLAAFVNSDMRAELGLIGAFYSSLASFQIAILRPALEKVVQDHAAEVLGRNISAQGYACLIVKEVISPQFSAFVEGIVLARLRGGEALTAADKEIMNLKVKLVLMLTALALLYKVETGAVTAKEVAGMLTGEMDIGEGDFKEVLIALIREHVAVLPEAERREILRIILEYLDSDPDVEELLEPSEVFRGILGTSRFAPVHDQAI